jgi:hypothetical protein
LRLAARARAAARDIALPLALGQELGGASQHRLELTHDGETRIEAVEAHASAQRAAEDAAALEALQLVLRLRQRDAEAIGELLALGLAVHGHEEQHLGRGGVAEEPVEHVSMLAPDI